MKKTLFLCLVCALSLGLILAGCGERGGQENASDMPDTSIDTPDPDASIHAPEIGEDGYPTDPEIEISEPQRPDPLEGLTPDAYDGIEISAAVLPRATLLPGSAVPLTVTVKNTGEQSVSYTRGSGAYETPEALLVQFMSLQVVAPKDHLGAVTMDFVTELLAPGETLEYTVYVMAIRPDESFDEHTSDIFAQDERYIADIEWSELSERYPELVAVEPDSYLGTVSFLYSLPDAGDEPLNGPTSYAQTDITIGIND